MSERTTIGGIVYETIGSSSSNLLLKCNGTARVQWGNKLIDLIKNGKIALSDFKEILFVISEEAEMKDNGIYILINENESYSVYLYKDKQKYVLTDSDLYISATKQQELTAEQKLLILKNIGIYYDTVDEFKHSGILNGIAYIISEKKFYTMSEGIIEIFTTNSINSVAVETKTTGNEINESVDEFTSNTPSTTSINLFTKGMIVMYNGGDYIPEGWAVCDGNSYTYNGNTYQTPNLTDKFIKTVSNTDEIGDTLVNTSDGEIPSNNYSLIFIIKL